MRRRDYLLVAHAEPRSCCWCSKSSSSSASAWLAFGVPVRGSWVALDGRDRCSARSRSAALGLLIASRAQTIEAVSGLMNLVMLPMWVLSGVFFSATQLSRRRAAVHPGAAADRAERRAARDHATRARDSRRWQRAGVLAGVDGRELRARAEAVPVAVATLRLWDRTQSVRLTTDVPELPLNGRPDASRHRPAPSPPSGCP